MVERHNEVVTDDDIHLFVGDISAGLRGREKHFQMLLTLMKGKKILVRGNHDHQPDQFYLDAGFVDVVDDFKIPPYFICHYPCYLSNRTNVLEKAIIEGIPQGITTIIHGHVHNKDPSEWDPDMYTRMNMCVDFEPNNYYPQELTQKEIVEYFHRYK